MPLSTLALALLAALPAAAQETATATQAEPPAAAQPTELDTIEVIGSRARGRTAAEAAAPVDVISREQLQSAGVQEIGQALQMLEPSFNFSRTFVSDGTDIIRPATLRALGPDQVLVLVNGKRRHQQALVNVQQTIGRGSAGTDINAIPISAIERIEVLRDGAAAQYGSDAISGVINIVLKRSTDTSGSLEVGQTYAGDGEVLHGGLNTGFGLADGGFLNFTFEYRDRGETNRAGPNLDLNPPRVALRLGDADSTDAYLWTNAAVPIGPGELYWFGGYSKRKGDSSGIFRAAGDERAVPEVYPDGFLPNLLTSVEDASLAFGYRAPLGENWDWDVSVNRGRSKFDFAEGNSINVSWWYEPKPDGSGIYAQSPNSAYTGGLQFDQTTFNLDFRGTVKGFNDNPLSLAAGFEWREDNYKIKAGDPVSYSYGRTNSGAIPILTPSGAVAPPGIQGFPGFTPGTAVDDGRHSMAVYLDAEAKLTQRFLLGAAVRFEDYSDFGNTTTGKLSARFDATEKFAIRGTLSTGFRAPGVQQQFYSQVSTNFDTAGNLTDTLTARQDSAVTRALGIKPLKEETSTSGTLGLVYKPSENTTFTVDVFRIDIKDRIIFSGSIGPEPVGTDDLPCRPDNGNCPIRGVLEPFRVGQAQFFTNAIDTKTQGIDIVAEHGIDFDGGSRLDLTALVHWNKTEVTKRKSQSDIIGVDKLFGDEQVLLVERGQPRAHHVLQGVYTTGNWSFLARANYFGSVAGKGFTLVKQTWGGEWLGDVAVGYRFNKNLKLTVGANNVFDAYPDKWDPVGGAPFPQMGFKYGWETLPFGTNGGYYYAKVDFRF